MRRKDCSIETDIPEHRLDAFPVGSPPVRTVTVQFVRGIKYHGRLLDFFGIEVRFDDRGLADDFGNACQGLEWIAEVVKNSAEKNKIKYSDGFWSQIQYIQITNFKFRRDMRSGEFDGGRGCPWDVGPNPVIRGQDTAGAKTAALDCVETIPAPDIQDGLPLQSIPKVYFGLCPQLAERSHARTDKSVAEIDLMEPAKIVYRLPELAFFRFRFPVHDMLHLRCGRLYPTMPCGQGAACRGFGTPDA